MKWLTPVKPEKNACPASALFQCSLIPSDAAAADHKATPPPPMKNARRRGSTGGGGVGGVRPDERALKQRTRWTCVFSGFTGVSHFACDLRWAAGADKLTEYACYAQFHSLNELFIA